MKELTKEQAEAIVKEDKVVQMLSKVIFSEMEREEVIADILSAREHDGGYDMKCYCPWVDCSRCRELFPKIVDDRGKMLTCPCCVYTKEEVLSVMKELFPELY